VTYFLSSNSFFFHTKYSGGKEIPGYEYFLWLRKAHQPSEILHHPSEGILLTGYQLDTVVRHCFARGAKRNIRFPSGIQVVSRWYPCRWYPALRNPPPPQRGHLTNWIPTGYQLDTVVSRWYPGGIQVVSSWGCGQVGRRESSYPRCRPRGVRKNERYPDKFICPKR
jgi:hypothetical protein